MSHHTKRIPRIAILAVFLLYAGAMVAETDLGPDVVTTLHDSDGWKLQVNGEDYFVKGVVWGYTPIGENYSYNLWANPDETIRNILDYECELMKQAGVNTIRSFGLIPPEWVTYIYRKHGIRTMINFLMGRYGYNVDGVWHVWTNYGDPRTREVLKQDFVEIVQQYHDVPGVLMFALGNESNYGLEWSSFEIENLPEGERYQEKARYLYSLFNEAMAAGKEVDSTHPYMIVNGDIQYLNLIVEECTDMDILGVNSYRGVSFTDMWQRVHNEAGLPILLTEFGSDAYNALEDREEQVGQAEIAYGNWREIYQKSYGKGEEGNALGGFQFEWRDEWWKYLQTENLEVHDRHASWSNGGYSFDFRQGVNNMNEEWFGICRLGETNDDGVSVAVPRMAYDVLAEIWKIDPYAIEKTEMNRRLEAVDMEYLQVKSSVRALAVAEEERKSFRFTGGSLKGDLAFKGQSELIEEKGKDGLGFTHGEMLYLDFAFRPTSRIDGELTLNILGNVVDLPLEQYYGKRGETYVTVTTEEDGDGLPVAMEKEIRDNERIEIYSFEARYQGKYYDFTSFYHVPRFHWIYEGDFFGLMREATDMEGMDIWNAKAPYGVEFKGKEALGGPLSNLTIVTGPEIYWGANPKAMIKYDFGGPGWDYTLIHSEDFARAEASATATEATERTTRQTALALELTAIPGVTLEVGYLLAGSEKLDETYQYMEDDQLYTDEIEFKDTQAIRTKVSFNLGATLIDASVHYAGLVADGGDVLEERDTTMPHTDLGNKIVYEAGLLIPVGNLWLMPRGMYREPLLGPMPYTEPYMDGADFYPGTTPRNRESDPFAVLGNRETISGEFFITYDPTPASYFYDWDADRKEDARLAFSIGGNYTRYETDTDAHLFYYQEGKTNAPFGSGLPAEELWLAKARMIANPNPNLKIIANLEAGKQQSTGNPDGDPAEYISLDSKWLFYKQYILEWYVKKDAWGPYDWFQQFNITYPWQFMLDYSILLDNMLDWDVSSKIGLKTIFRTLEEDSPGNEAADVDNDYEFQTGLYYRIDF